MPPYSSTAGTVLYAEGQTVFRRRGHAPAQRLVSVGAGHIVDIVANKSGSLLAVATQTAVHVWITEPEDPARPLSLPSVPLDGEILRLAWHPCARSDAGLVLLTRHSVVSIYCPPGEDAVVETTRLVDSEQIALDAAGVSFGSADSPDGDLTLYVATTDGDVYAQCPFVPPEIELPPERLAVMREFALVGKWPIELESWAGHGKVMVLKRPSHADLPLRITGEPLKLTPYPDELYEEDVLDLAVGSLGRSWAADLVVQTTARFVNFFIAEGPSSESLVLVAAVRFKHAQQDRRVRLITAQVVVIDTTDSTHVLHIGEWTSELGRRRRGGDPATQAADLPVTRVERIPHSYAFVMPRSVEAVQVGGGPTHSWPFQPAASEPDLASRLEGLGLDVGGFLREHESPQTSITRMDVGPGDAVPTTTLAPNLAALYDLDSLAQTYESKVLLILKALVEMQYSRQAQREELLDQLEKASGLPARVSTAESKTATLKNALAAAEQRQKQLSERIQRLTARITSQEELNSRSQPLSLAEEKWLEDLEGNLSQRVAAAQAQFNEIQSSTSALKLLRGQAQPAAASQLTPAQTRTIRNRLQQQEALISSIKQSLSQKS